MTSRTAPKAFVVRSLLRTSEWETPTLVAPMYGDIERELVAVVEHKQVLRTDGSRAIASDTHVEKRRLAGPLLAAALACGVASVLACLDTTPVAEARGATPAAAPEAFAPRPALTPSVAVDTPFALTSGTRITDEATRRTKRSGREHVGRRARTRDRAQVAPTPSDRLTGARQASSLQAHATASDPEVVSAEQLQRLAHQELGASLGAR